MRTHRHPANITRHDDRDFGQRAADRVTRHFGSWSFLIAQSVLIVVWVGVNVAAYLGSWDPYPFILLNLLFSVQAAYAAPLILLSQNRSSEHDRQRAEEDYTTNAEALRLLRQLVDGTP